MGKRQPGRSNNGTAYAREYGYSEAVDTPEFREGLRKLAEASPVDYDLVRDGVAQDIGVHVLTLDRMVERARDRASEQNLSGAIAIDAFEEQFVPPEYLVEGIIQTRYLYTLTGHSNAGKTALAAALTCAVDSGTPFGGAETLCSPVLYLCGENVDDFRLRIMATYQEHWVHHPRKERRVHIIDHAFPIRKHVQFVLDEVERLGGVRLIVIDTSIAYSDYEEENANAQIAEHARSCRKLTRALGDPAVIVLCHPTKSAIEDNLIPRGGSAMLNEVDTNLTLWFCDNEVRFSHTKIRGVPFDPLTFRFRPVELVGRVDAKDRPISSVVMQPISDAVGESRRRSPQKQMPSNAKIAYRALREVLQEHGKSLSEGTSVIPAHTPYVEFTVWRQHFDRLYGEEEGGKSTRRSFFGGKDWLLANGMIRIYEQFVWSHI